MRFLSNGDLQCFECVPVCCQVLSVTACLAFSLSPTSPNLQRRYPTSSVDRVYATRLLHRLTRLTCSDLTKTYRGIVSFSNKNSITCEALRPLGYAFVRFHSSEVKRLIALLLRSPPLCVADSICRVCV